VFFRIKPAGSYRYLQIVHSVRKGQKVRQQMIATLGRLDLLVASGQLERLMRPGLRHREKFAVIDAHAAGEIEPVAIRRIGPDLVFARLRKESGIPEVLRSLLKARHYEFDVERAIYLTVLHRLFASGSDRAATALARGLSDPWKRRAGASSSLSASTRATPEWGQELGRQ
jgi:hypothetical protein